MYVEDKDKAKALAALYNHSRPLGAGILRYDPANMTEEQAAKLLETTTYFDYLKGRVMKMDFGTNNLDFRLYDRDNGAGEGEMAVLEVLTPPSRNHNIHAAQSPV